MQTMLKQSVNFRVSTLAIALTAMALTTSNVVAIAQAAAAPAAATSQRGTVKAIEGNTLTLTTAAGATVAVRVSDTSRVLQVAPGSKDLTSAQTIALKDIAVGDAVLVSGKPAEDPATFNAVRVILMKSGDIAQKRQADQVDWQRRGGGGIVTAVTADTLTITSGAKKITVNTSPTTKFRRYAGDSVKFEDTVAGTHAQVQPGDQLRVRGDKSEDGFSIQAEEVVSGSFKNLAGVIATINAATGTITLKDLTTKQNMTIKVTANSDIRKLPAQTAAMFAARARSGTAGASAAGAPAAGAPAAGAPAAGAAPSGEPRGAGGYGGGQGGPGGPGGGMGRSAGGDLSQMFTRLPTATIAELKIGDAVMIVASQEAPTSTTVTAVTVLGGVEPILAATPTGSPAITMAPWSVGTGGAEAGGGGPQ